MSYAAGSNKIEDFGDDFNIDMNAEYYHIGWPASRDDSNWRHSDMKNIPYTYIYLFYDEIIQKGVLDAQ